MSKPEKNREWRGMSEEILVGMTEWRQQHAKATFREIEERKQEHFFKIWIERNERVVEGVVASIPAEQPTEVRERIIQKITNYLKFSSNFVVSGTIDAKIHLIKAERDLPGQDTRMQWSASTTRQFYVYDGFGDHGVMLDQEYVQSNGEIIRQIILSELRTEPAVQ